MNYCYCRVSSDAQGRDGVSLDAQEKRLRNQAIALGGKYQIIKEVGSGRSTDQRPKFQQILNKIEKDDVLLVYDQSRYGRDSKTDLATADLLRKKGAKLYIDGRFINLENPNDVLIFSISSATSTWQTHVQEAKSVEAMNIRRQMGDYIFPPQYGYRLWKEKGSSHITINPAEASNLVEAYNMYIHGSSLQNINRKFKMLNLDLTLHSPLNMGYYFRTPKLQKKMRYLSRAEIEADLIKSNIYPPIIPEDIWWQAWNRWKTNSRSHQIRITAKSDIAGLIRCPQCGTTAVYRGYSRKDGYSVPRLDVTAHNPDCSYSRRSFMLNDISYCVRACSILTFLCFDEIGDFLKEKAAKNKEETKDLELQKSELLESLKSEKKKRDNLLDAIMDGVISSNIAKAKMAEIESRIVAVEKDISDLNIAILSLSDDSMDFLEHGGEELINTIVHGSKELRRELYLKSMKATYSSDGYIYLDFINGKKYEIGSFQRWRREADPVAFKIIYKGDEQATGVLDSRNKKVVFNPIAINGDKENNASFSAYVNRSWEELAEKTMILLEEACI